MKNKHWDDFPLYDPRNEHDACGMGFIVNLKVSNRTTSSPRGSGS